MTFARGRQVNKDGWAKAFMDDKLVTKKAGQTPKGAI